MNTIQRTYSASPLLERATGDRQVWFRLVTASIDRHKTIILPDGVDLTTHRANPVFLWMHQSSAAAGSIDAENLRVALPAPAQPPPQVVIGRVVDYEQSADHLDICVEFDVDEMAELCFQKVRRGFLRAVSIGCNVLEQGTRDVDGVAVPVYLRTELLEASLVIIPSNPQALVLDRASAVEVLRGIDEPPQVQPETRADAPQAHVGGDVADEDAAIGDDEGAALSSGVIVCLYPIAGLLDGLVLPSGEPAAALHVTLAYVPPDGLPDGWEDRLTVILRGVVDRFPVMRGEVGGVGRFSGSQESRGLDVIYASPDVPRLIDLASAVQCEMRWAEFDVSRKHGWTPHITLAYVSRDAATPVSRIDPVPVAFDCVSFTAGNVRHDFALAAPDRVSAVAERGSDPVQGAPTTQAPAATDSAPIDRPIAGIYLARDAVNQGEPPTRTEELAMPIKMSPECRWAMRSVLAHTMDGAEMHAQMADLAPDEHKKAHRDMAMSNLGRVDDLHKMYAAAFSPAEDEGATRSVPDLKDTELRARFAEVAARVGKLPVTPAQVLRQHFGSDDVGNAMVELTALRDDRTDLQAMRSAAKTEAAKTEAAKREDLIARNVAPGVAIITPATAQEMRGVDPATGAPVATGPWSLARVETYIQKRMASGAGPAVDLTRTGPLRSADPAATQPAAPSATLQPAAAPTQAAGPSLVRVMSRNGGGNAAQVAAQALQNVPGLTAEELQRSINVLSAAPGVQDFADGAQKINVK